MLESTARVDTNSSSSSSLSNQASFLQNSSFYDLVGQFAEYLHLNPFSDTLSRLSEQVAYLDQKIDHKFGEMEKPFSSPIVLKIKDVQDSASNITSSSFSSRFNFPELHSKDSKNLREKVRGEIKKDSKVRDINSSFREQFEDHSSSSSSSGISSLPHKKSKSDLSNDLDKQVVT
jgi:arginine utilization protein RocB